jgi:predicted nucleic acid-binding protein
LSGTWVLDCEALSAYLRLDKKMTARLGIAQEDDVRVVVSPATIVEADHESVHPARLDWVLSRLVVLPVTREVARSAVHLLRATGLHGHTYAIDSMVVATALSVPDKPATILTSDPGDISVLLGDRRNRKSGGSPADLFSVRVVAV